VAFVSRPVLIESGHWSIHLSMIAGVAIISCQPGIEGTLPLIGSGK
jgi:hypothetical protein